MDTRQNEVTADKSYNGWTNYETWLVNLWLTNEEVSDATLREIVKHGQDYEAADALKAWVKDEYLPDLGAGLASDLVGAALSEVDWLEIVTNHRAD